MPQRTEADRVVLPRGAVQCMVLSGVVTTQCQRQCQGQTCVVFGIVSGVMQKQIVLSSSKYKEKEKLQRDTHTQTHTHTHRRLDKITPIPK